MTRPVFNPPLPPSTSTRRSMKPRVLMANFGDGYSMRAADGINHMPDAMEVCWSMLRPADAKVIRDFLTARRGTESFLWTAPRDPAARQWVCLEWNTSYPNQTHEAINASFRQVFDL